MKNLSERIHRMLVADFSLGNRTAQSDHAVVVTNPEFPLIPESNLVHSVRLPEADGLPALLAEVEPQLAAARTPWRHVVLDPGTRPADLGERLRNAGYETSARVGAAYLSSPRPEPLPKMDVRGIAGKSAWARFSDLRRHIQAGEGRLGEELDQYATLARRRSVSSNLRFYLALREFEPVGHVGLLSVGRTGMIVDLAVKRERRGAGIGRGLIRRMVDQSRGLGHDLTCVVHDDREDLNRLFARMGFDTAARFESYLRRQDADAPAPPPA